MTTDTLPLWTLSRKSDPPSSARSVKELSASGALATQARQVLDALKTFGPCSSKTLAERSGLDRHLVGRRLPDLERRGLVTRSQQGSADVIWTPAAVFGETP